MQICKILNLSSVQSLTRLNLPAQIKRLIGRDKETLSVLERFVAGSMAGVIAQSTIYPMEVSRRSLYHQINFGFERFKRLPSLYPPSGA